MSVVLLSETTIRDGSSSTGGIGMANFGEGAFRYKVVDGFFKRPRGWPFVEVADVAVDGDDNVYVFNLSLIHI